VISKVHLSISSKINISFSLILVKAKLPIIVDILFIILRSSREFLKRFIRGSMIFFLKVSFSLSIFNDLGIKELIISKVIFLSISSILLTPFKLI
jgi:hypothetical protein